MTPGNPVVYDQRIPPPIFQNTSLHAVPTLTRNAGTKHPRVYGKLRVGGRGQGALALYRSAGAVAKAGKMAESCLNEKGVVLDGLQVLLWAGLRSQGTGDLSAARTWYGLVARTMPEHEVARTARALLKALPTDVPAMSAH